MIKMRTNQAKDIYN